MGDKSACIISLMLIHTTLHYLDLIGTVVFAMTGLLAASRKALDLFGAIVIAMVTAIGGGTLRDLLLGQPVFWVTQPIYVYIVVISALFLFFFARLKPIPITPLVYLDALGLAAFTIIGTQKAMLLGLDDAIAIMTGMMTGVVGGVIRDVLMGEVPLIFRKEIYATASFVGASLFLLLSHWQVAEDVVISLSVITIFLLRYWAIRRDIRLPIFQPLSHD